jgi:hypothetical protein
MLIIDDAEFDEVELEEMISDRCSEWGSVMDVEICRVSDPFSYDLAIVEMSNEEEASEVVKELGGDEYGASVVMKILHKGKLIAAPDTLH